MSASLRVWQRSGSRPLRAPFGKRRARAIGLLPPRALHGRAASLQRFARVAELGLPDAFRSWISFVQDPDRAALLDGHRDDWAIEDYREIWDASAGAATLDRLLDLNLRTYLVDDLLVKTDRMSMAHGLEVRCPFLDAELISYATRLPPQFKARGMTLKRVLRMAVEDLLPRESCDVQNEASGCRLIAGFARTYRATSPRPSVPRMPVSRSICQAGPWIG